MANIEESTTRGCKIPETLTDGERAALLKRPNRRCPTALRYLCILHVMLDAGLHSAEALKLKVNHIDWMSEKLKVKQGKGSKDRIPRPNESAMEAL